MRINLGEIIIDKEIYFKASLKNPKQMNLEEENNLNKIKEKDLFPTFVKTKFVLDHISHNDFRDFTLEQIKRSLSESDFKKVMSSDKTLQELVAKEDDYIKLISEYLGHKDIGKDTSEIEKKLETNLKEIHALRKEVDGAIKQTGLTIIDLKTETKIKEISVYKEILELNNNLDILSNMDKINLMNNFIEVQSKIGNLTNIREEDTNFNKYSNQLKAGLKFGDLNEVELTSLYNNLLMSMDKFYNKMSLNNDSFEKNPTFALYKSEINDFQSKDNYLQIVEKVKNENPDLIAKKYKQDIEIKNKEEVASSSIVDVIKDTIDSMEDIEIGGFKL